ncbi:VacJ family lipoprotein [Parendozoicomonas sp. Alg238-R29]|uniref:MlaA family lipoprotein n=1 Tax=Parendozoicomonas sp. Alg238-R29 TaxID=2993446 RepID=UPI00248D984E|nr:VacJ family lipoprotein [Parendozoicomonas sp. Alg238-R29]
MSGESAMLHRYKAGLKTVLFLMVLGCTSTLQAATVNYNDPWEPVNRVTFAFNDKLDAWVLKPVATGYDTVTPDPVQGLVSNFFKNLGEIRNLANALLQFRIKDAGVTTGRFVVNSTVGMLGMLDVGSEIGLDYRYQDFGLTLAHWHVPAGPYVVIPFFGPRTVRSTAGLYPDMMVDPVTNVNDSHDRLMLQVSDLISLRAELLKQEGLIVGDKYTFIRDAYLQRRDFLITGEVPQDDF